MNNDKLTVIEMKLESIIERLHEMNVTLAENTKSLIVHEKRTDIAERKMELLNDRVDSLKEDEHAQFKELTQIVDRKFGELEAKLTPIKNHVEVLDKVFGMVWKIIIPCILTSVGILYKFGILKIGN
jgi:hypothetical protein